MKSHTIRRGVASVLAAAMLCLSLAACGGSSTSSGSGASVDPSATPSLGSYSDTLNTATISRADGVVSAQATAADGRTMYYTASDDTVLRTYFAAGEDAATALSSRLESNLYALTTETVTASTGEGASAILLTQTYLVTREAVEMTNSAFALAMTNAFGEGDLATVTFSYLYGISSGSAYPASVSVSATNASTGDTILGATYDGSSLTYTAGYSEQLGKLAGLMMSTSAASFLESMSYRAYYNAATMITTAQQLLRA